MFTPAFPSSKERPAFVWAAWWLLVLVLALRTNAEAHPIHTSLAELEYAQSAGTLKVSLRVFADDFEAALTAREKRKVALDETPPAEFDALARAYLADHFIVKSKDGARLTWRWIGRELKETANELWLFFDAPLPDGVEGAVIHHAMLRDQFSSQLNSVHIRDGARRATLVFLPSHREKRVRFRP